MAGAVSQVVEAGERVAVVAIVDNSSDPVARGIFATRSFIGVCFGRETGLLAIQARRDIGVVVDVCVTRAARPFGIRRLLRGGGVDLSDNLARARTPVNRTVNRTVK
jgi:hypothetical protein